MWTVFLTVAISSEINFCKNNNARRETQPEFTRSGRALFSSPSRVERGNFVMIYPSEVLVLSASLCAHLRHLNFLALDLAFLSRGVYCKFWQYFPLSKVYNILVQVKCSSKNDELMFNMYCHCISLSNLLVRPDGLRSFRSAHNPSYRGCHSF